MCRNQDYKTSLFNKQQFTNTMSRIQAEKHQLYTMEIEKKSLSPFNDKKWITRDGDIFTSYSYGHYKINKVRLLQCDNHWVGLG